MGGRHNFLMRMAMKVGELETRIEKALKAWKLGTRFGEHKL